MASNKQTITPNVELQSGQINKQVLRKTHAQEVWNKQHTKNAAKWAARYASGHVTALCPTYDILRG